MPLSADALLAHSERIERDGYTILESVIDPSFVDAVAEDLARIEREQGIGYCKSVFEGERTVRIYNLLTHGELYEQIPVHPEVLPLVEQVLDSGCLVSSLSSISIDPGESAQLLHADDQLIPLEKPHAPLVCNSMWALTDFRFENGATRFVPGTHRADRNPHPFNDEEGARCAEMPKGSVLVWNGSLWHGGGTNQSDERRVGIAMNYCAGFVRQQENQQLGISRERAKRFSPRLQRLCGYSVYNDLIGHIDRRDPIELLGTSPSNHKLVWDG